MNPRWKTFEPGREDEEAQRVKILRAIERWWQEFARQSDDIVALFKGEAQWDLPEWMGSHLHEIHPQLMWEFGPGIDSGHRLVITPEYRFDLRPLVDEILERAPSLPGWSFYGHRLPESWETALSTVEARTGTELAATGFRCSQVRFNLIEVVIEFPKRFLAAHEELASSQAFVLLESLLGEATLNAWVGEVSVAKKSWRSTKLASLPSAFETMRQSIVEGLPKVPIRLLPGELQWTLFQLEPSEAEDYPRQLDMIVGKAIDPEQWENSYRDVPYFSTRYTRSGDTFCFLKIDGAEGLDGTPWQDKGDIEDVLEEALRSSELGCLVSGGTGLRYVYLDFALTDVPRALATIKDVLRTGGLTRRSWILFFDSEWESEWVGIWPDSPPPPKGQMH